jgi:DinB superfamily
MKLAEATQLRLNTQLDCLQVILEGASLAALSRKSAPDKWSAVQNLAHLGRYHEVFLERLERIRSEDRPALGRYSAEADPAWAEWSQLPLEEVRARLLALRRTLVEAVGGLPETFLLRTAVHSTFGEMNVALWMEFFLLHETHHLYRVFQLARPSSSGST